MCEIWDDSEKPEVGQAGVTLLVDQDICLGEYQLGGKGRRG